MRAAEASAPGSRKIADRFDPFSADYLADPYPTLADARDAAPAFYSAYLEHWVVTRYADVRHVLRTTAEFSAINALEPLSKLCPHAASILKEGGYAATPALTNLDPPGHARQRRLANAAFTPKRVAAPEPFIRDLAQRFCDERLREGHADMIGDFAWAFPALVLFMFSDCRRRTLCVSKRARAIAAWSSTGGQAKTSRPAQRANSRRFGGMQPLWSKRGQKARATISSAHLLRPATWAATMMRWRRKKRRPLMMA